ncbi:MAG: hypothetical protein JST00_34810 [Deltaproteobacteria bacterium]|nr:hypothetical protein [Deltaproteobacteria bacterium]
MPFEAEARIVRRGGLRSVASFVLGAAFVLFLAAQSEIRALFPVAVGLVIGGAALALASRYQSRPGSTRHRVTAAEAGLAIDGEVVLTHAQISNVHLAKVQDGWAVHVDGRGFRHALSVVFPEDDEQAAVALVDALRVGPASAVAKFRALPPWARHVRWLAVLLTTSPWILINFLRILPLWSWGVILAGYGVIALPMLLPQRVEVGDDGVLLRWLGHRRFVPFTAIEEVESDPQGAVLVLKSGRRLPILLTYKADADDDRRAKLLRAIEQRMRAHAALGPAEEDALLARGSRDLATWLRDMQEIGTGSGAGGGYRALAIPEARLWEILENPSADPSAREGAALALHASLDEAGREKVRALSRTTASPRLRVALDGVAKESDQTRLRVALDLAEREEAEPPSERMEARRHRA